MLGLLLLLLLVLFELLLNLHKLMVRPIFEEDYIPHGVDFLQALVHLLYMLALIVLSSITKKGEIVMNIAPFSPF